MTLRVQSVVPYLLGLPALVFMGVLLLLPVGFLISLSFFKPDDEGVLLFSLDAYQDIFSDPYNLAMIVRTIKISAITTIISLVLAFPVALYLRQVSARTRAVISFILISPLLTSVVVRTLAWIILLSPKGIINSALIAVGLEPVKLLYNQVGVIIGLTHVFFGYMAISLMTSVIKIDENLLLAASNLGAKRFTILREILIPLSFPGILSGSILVFTMSASTYATPMLLGGSATKLMATEIYDQAVNYLDWQSASALACVLLVCIALLVFIAGSLAERDGRKSA